MGAALTTGRYDSAPTAEAAMAPAPAQTHEAMRAHAAVDIMAKSQGDQEAAQV